MGFEPTWACAQRHLKPPLIPFSNGRKLPASYLADSGGGTRSRPECAVPRTGRARQNLGTGAAASTISAASSFVSTDGGEPSSGFWAVSFMQATAMTPTSAAAIE